MVEAYSHVKLASGIHIRHKKVFEEIDIISIDIL